jgi:hypothetical protein
MNACGRELGHGSDLRVDTPPSRVTSSAARTPTSCRSGQQKVQELRIDTCIASPTSRRDLATIARRFNAGKTAPAKIRPGGTVEVCAPSSSAGHQQRQSSHAILALIIIKGVTRPDG